MTRLLGSIVALVLALVCASASSASWSTTATGAGNARVASSEGVMPSTTDPKSDSQPWLAEQVESRRAAPTLTHQRLHTNRRPTNVATTRRFGCSWSCTSTRNRALLARIGATARGVAPTRRTITRPELRPAGDVPRVHAGPPPPPRRPLTMTYSRHPFGVKVGGRSPHAAPKAEATKAAAAHDRIYALALAVAADAADGDVLGTFDRTSEGLHDVVFNTTLGLCDEDPALTLVDDPAVVSGIADEAINDYLRNNPEAKPEAGVQGVRTYIEPQSYDGPEET